MSPTPIKPPRPTTPARAAAARANGAKSRGPVTAEGKAHSSHNSRTHGLHSCNPFHDPAWPALLASIEDEVQPQSPVEHQLAETLALCHWRQRYIMNLERTILEDELARIAPQHPGENNATLLALAFRSLADRTRILDRIHRIEKTLSRIDDRALGRFISIRAQRASASEKTNITERTRGVSENKITISEFEPEKPVFRTEFRPESNPSNPNRTHPCRAPCTFSRRCPNPNRLRSLTHGRPTPAPAPAP